MPEIRDIGVDVKPPQGEWDGNMNCPFYFLYDRCNCC